jgi:hypothetical protein
MAKKLVLDPTSPIPAKLRLGFWKARARMPHILFSTPARRILVKPIFS